LVVELALFGAVFRDVLPRLRAGFDGFDHAAVAAVGFVAGVRYAVPFLAQPFGQRWTGNPCVVADAVPQEKVEMYDSALL